MQAPATAPGAVITFTATAQVPGGELVTASNRLIVMNKPFLGKTFYSAGRLVFETLAGVTTCRREADPLLNGVVVRIPREPFQPWSLLHYDEGVQTLSGELFR